MALKNRFIWLLCAMFLAAGIFMFYGGIASEYIMERRTFKLITIVMVSCCVAYSSVIFQTITGNKILTPAIMGFEAVYLLFQTAIVFVYGDKTFQVLTNGENFLLSVVFMMLFALLMYMLIFKKGNNNLYLLLLIGLVMGTLFSTLSSFMQLVIDPNEFSIIEGKMFASFNRINMNLFWLSMGTLALVFVIGHRYVKYLDVIALGKENAINLGVRYDRVVRLFLLLISVLVAVSTALVGPITFLGILVTNLTYELFKTHRHSILISACCVVSCISLICGQFLVENLFNFSTTISIIINFLGGVYFLFLLMKTQKA